MLRTWGSELATGDILSTENVDTATLTVPGVAPTVTLNWGAHGRDQRTASGSGRPPGTSPPPSRSGDSTLRITYTLESGKTGTYDYVITIVPLAPPRRTDMSMQHAAVGLFRKKARWSALVTATGVLLLAQSASLSPSRCRSPRPAIPGTPRTAGSRRRPGQARRAR